MDALLQCLLLSSQPAGETWKQWRAGIDIDALPYPCQQFLPALNPHLSAWLEDDPAAGIFQGIVRMVWTQNQVRLRQAVEAMRVLEEAGVELPAIVGPVAWSLLGTHNAIRAIPCLSFLVTRADAPKATEALIRAGWRAHATPPGGEELDWCDHISFDRENLPLTLHWRLIPVAPEEAVACESAFVTRLSTIEWQRQRLRTISAEATLLHMLCGHRNADFLPWQADVALFDKARVDWKQFRRLARRFAPLALERLRDLRHGNLSGLPELPADHLASVPRKFRLLWKEYRAWRYRRKESPHWRGFVRFLAAQWHAPSLWQLPIIGARRAFRHLRSVSRQ